jgi:hypothetical protein
MWSNYCTNLSASLLDSSTLKLNVEVSFKVQVTNYQTQLNDIREKNNCNIHCHSNHKLHMPAAAFEDAVEQNGSGSRMLWTYFSFCTEVHEICIMWLILIIFYLFSNHLYTIYNPICYSIFPQWIITFIPVECKFLSLHTHSKHCLCIIVTHTQVWDFLRFIYHIHNCL